MLLNRNLPTRCHETTLRAFISWIAGMAIYWGKWSLTCRMLCEYSIGAPIGAGQIYREKHYRSLCGKIVKRLLLHYIYHENRFGIDNQIENSSDYRFWILRPISSTTLYMYLCMRPMAEWDMILSHWIYVTSTLPLSRGPSQWGSITVTWALLTDYVGILSIVQHCKSTTCSSPKKATRHWQMDSLQRQVALFGTVLLWSLIGHDSILP